MTSDPQKKKKNDEAVRLPYGTLTVGDRIARWGGAGPMVAIGLYVLLQNGWGWHDYTTVYIILAVLYGFNPASLIEAVSFFRWRGTTILYFILALMGLTITGFIHSGTITASGLLMWLSGLSLMIAAPVRSDELHRAEPETR